MKYLIQSVDYVKLLFGCIKSYVTANDLKLESRRRVLDHAQSVAPPQSAKRVMHIIQTLDGNE